MKELKQIRLTKEVAKERKEGGRKGRKETRRKRGKELY